MSSPSAETWGTHHRRCPFSPFLAAPFPLCGSGGSCPHSVFLGRERTRLDLEEEEYDYYFLLLLEYYFLLKEEY